MKFAIHKNGIDPVRDRIAASIVTELKNNGLDVTSMEKARGARQDDLTPAQIVSVLRQQQTSPSISPVNRGSVDF